MVVHFSHSLWHMCCSGRLKPTRLCLQFQCEPAQTPQLVLLAAFPRPLSRCYPRSYRPPLLRLLCPMRCAEHSGLSTSYLCNCCHRARKARSAGVYHTYLQALLLSGQHRISVIGTGTVHLGFLLSTLPLDTKHDATDCFMRDTMRSCYGAERLFLLHHTLYQR
jgi:hypothetical protein